METYQGLLLKLTLKLSLLLASLVAHPHLTLVPIHKISCGVHTPKKAFKDTHFPATTPHFILSL